MSQAAVTFIYTNSYDATADLLVSRMGSENVFRFNFNMWRDYRIRMGEEGFEIGNPAGRSVTADNVAKFYWRKPMRWKHMFPDVQVADEVNYMEEELWYAMRELANLLWRRGRVVLVEPFGDARAGKLVQAAIARRYFRVPSYQFVCGDAKALQEEKIAVVKSLTSTRVEKGAVFYTTQVRQNELDPKAPWMIQELVEAEKDITVAFVRDRIFSYELDREPFVGRTLDWREMSTDSVTQDWPVHPLPADVERGIFSLMAELGLQYGRIDLLYSRGTYHFLEVNANGEWGWLDAEGTNGLLDKIVEEIAPDTAVHPIPYPRTLRN